MFSKKIFTLIIIAVSLIIAASGYYYYRDLEKRLIIEQEKDLAVIAQLKINQMEQWMLERKADIRVFSESTSFSNQVANWIEQPDNKSTTDYIKERIQICKEEYLYESIHLISKNNKSVLCTGEISDACRAKYWDYENLHLNKENIYYDFYLNKKEEKIFFEVIVPILDENDDQIAILIFWINPDLYLYPLIQTWPTPSKTSETLLIQKKENHVLFLNELRHKKHTALKLKMPISQKTLPAVMAADGTTGIVNGYDYRDVEVLAYVAPVPETNWYMVSKIDKDELLKELASQSLFIFLVTILVIIIFTFGLWLLQTLRQKNVYHSLWKTQEEFKTTLYSIGDAVITTDKKGHIKQINKIAEKLTGWAEEDATNKPLAEVFNIINEQSREKVENPVRKVLKYGKIVGLANHTILIAKNKKETPIADSAAPIRDSEGKIIGTVLVFRDQTEEKRHIEELVAAKEKAEESDQLKTAFLANMSHEIRTPLNGILGFSSIIAEEEISFNQRKGYHKIIENSGERLLNIVNDILDISMIQSNQIKIQKKEFLLNEFLEEIFTLYQTINKEQIDNIKLVLKRTRIDDTQVINTDKDRLFQIFKNLLDNAYKFTNQGSIEIGAVAINSHITCFVKDSGVGIPHDKIDFIFEKFQQIHDKSTKRSDGTGLGLAITKGLVERLGGKIWVESTINKGTTFYFELPMN